MPAPHAIAPTRAQLWQQVHAPRATIPRSYQIIEESDSTELAEFLSKNGQLLLPMLELIQQARTAADEAIDVSGRAAFKLDAKAGMGKLELAGWLERGGWDAAAGSLREGLSDMFTLQRLGLPPSLCRCLATTNLVDSSHSGLREKTRRVTHWQDETMALRWAGGALLATAEKFRRIMGYQQLWMLEAHLKEAATSAEVVTSRKTG